MNVRTRKVLRDIWQNKTRTILVIISIAVGLMAVSMTFRARAIFRYNLEAGLTSINQSGATLLTSPIDEDWISAVERLDQIEEAEGVQAISARIWFWSSISGCMT